MYICVPPTRIFHFSEWISTKLGFPFYCTVLKQSQRYSERAGEDYMLMPTMHKLIVSNSKERKGGKTIQSNLCRSRKEEEGLSPFESPTTPKREVPWVALCTWVNSSFSLLLLLPPEIVGFGFVIDLRLSPFVLHSWMEEEEEGVTHANWLWGWSSLPTKERRGCCLEWRWNCERLRR